MNSRTTDPFWKLFEDLPEGAARAARAAYRTWQRNPFHAALRFKEVRPGIWSVRIGLHWRALAHQDALLMMKLFTLHD